MSQGERIATSRTIFFAILATAILLVLVSAVRFQAPALVGAEKVLTDFDAFNIAGTLAANGRVEDAYHAETMLKAQREASGTQSFMPWTYPPPFTLLMDVLSHVPIGFAFALFSMLSFAFYLVVLRKIAGKWTPGVLMAIMPAIILNLRTGQNGFLIAGLIGAFLIAWRENRTIAGLPLGLLIIKPHLAVGVGLMALIGRRWGAIAVAAAVVIAALIASTVVYGLEIWSAFFGAVQEAGHFLSLGYYLLFRMNSAYAALYSFGLPAPIAMAGHVLVAFAAIGITVWACCSGMEFRFKAALVCITSLFVSPYNYDYDLAILGVALAFVIPDLVARSQGRELVYLLLLSWVTCGYGIGVQTVLEALKGGAVTENLGEFSCPAIIFPMLIVLFLVSAWKISGKSGKVFHKSLPTA